MKKIIIFILLMVILSSALSWSAIQEEVGINGINSSNSFSRFRVRRDGDVVANNILGGTQPVVICLRTGDTTTCSDVRGTDSGLVPAVVLPTSIMLDQADGSMEPARGGLDVGSLATLLPTVNVVTDVSGITGNKIRDANGGNNLIDGLPATALYGFDGTNWDRIQTLANNIDDVSVSTTGNLSTQSFNYEFDGTTYDRIRHSFSQSTTGITTNAAGTTVTMTSTPMSKYTMIIDRTAGATNVVEIDLQCSINNTAFVQIATVTDLTNEPALISTEGTPCAYMRYNVVTVGAGNTLAIDLLAIR